MKPISSQNNILNVQCGAIHYQSVISTFSDVPQFGELAQPCRCYLVEYTNRGSKFYFSKPGVFGPDGIFITEVLKEDLPRNDERYFNDAYQTDPNVFSTTLTLTNQQILGGTGFMFRQKFDDWIGAFMGQLTPIEGELLNSKVPDVWMQIFQKNAPSPLPEHTVFDVMKVNYLDQVARFCFTADIFFIQATIHSDDAENVETLLVYEFIEICFLQVIEPILKRPRDFDIEEFRNINVSWLEKSSRYLVSFPNEEEQDKMHRFFENLNFSRKIDHAMNARIPPLPNIYQGKGQVNRKTIEDYFLSVELAFNGESNLVDIPAENGTYKRFQIIPGSEEDLDKLSDVVVPLSSGSNIEKSTGKGSDESQTTHLQETAISPVLSSTKEHKEFDADLRVGNQENEVKRNGYRVSNFVKILSFVIVIGCAFFTYRLYNTSESLAEKRFEVFEPHPASSSATDHKLKAAIDLPSLLRLLMIDEKKSQTWTLGSNAKDEQILWLSSGIEPASNCGSYSGCRKGFVRVKLQGAEMQQLRKQLAPIEWSIFMASSGAPKLGPDVIQVTPECDTVECSFSFEKALSGSEVRLTPICAAGPSSSRATAFLAKLGSKLAYIVVMNNIGSGGQSTNLKIFYSKGAAAAICAEEKQYE